MGWIGVDLDGTLAHYESWGDGSIGAPIPAMVDRVKAWLAEGQEVRIMTARVSAFYHRHATQRQWLEAAGQIQLIAKWCREHVGQELEATSLKDFAMIELWDDRCVAVEANTGRALWWHPERGQMSGGTGRTSAPADEPS